MYFDRQNPGHAAAPAKATSDLWREILPLLVLVGMWCFFLRGAFGASRSFALFMDNEFFIGSVLSSMSSSFGGGEWPLRMPTVVGGVPLYNFAQLSPFYPFYLAIFPLFKTPLDAAATMHSVVLGHLLVFAINTYILMRVLRLSRMAAVTGAVFLVFGPNSLAYAVWMNIVAPYSWLPLYLAGVIGILEGRKSLKFPLAALVAIVLLSLASPSQPLIHAVMLTGILVLIRGVQPLLSKAPGLSLGSILMLASVGIISILLASPVLVPTAIGMGEMIRWIGPYPPVVGYDQIPFQAFLYDQLSISELGGVFVKTAAKSVGSQFVGPVAVTLSLCAIFMNWRSWIVLAMGFVAVYALASAAGGNLGLAYVNYMLPLVNKIREPSRFLFLFQLAISVLCAFGIDEIRKLVSGADAGKGLRAPLIIAGVVAGVSLLFSVSLGGADANRFQSLVAMGLLLAAIVATLAAARRRWRSSSEKIGLCWSLAVISVLATSVSWLPPSISHSTYLTNDGVALDVALDRVNQLDPQHNYRVVFEGSIDKQMASMLASYVGIRTLNFYLNPAPFQQFSELYNHGPRKDNYLQILGARYLICKDCGGSKYEGFKFRESINGYDLHEAVDALPHVYSAYHVDGQFGGIGDFIDKAAAFSLTDGLLFVEQGKEMALGSGGSRSGGCVIREEAEKNNLLRYLVSCASPAMIVVNEFFSESWRARVDGVEVEALRVNGNQIGVPLGPGGHVVELYFKPDIFVFSLLLPVIGGVLLLCWLLWIRRRVR